MKNRFWRFHVRIYYWSLFAFQKDSFCTPKGLVLQAKRTHFESPSVNPFMPIPNIIPPKCRLRHFGGIMFYVYHLLNVSPSTWSVT